MPGPARWWHPDGDRVVCELCPHGCRIADGRRGLCGVREARGAELWSLNDGILAAAHLDPIEKKPLYHFHPGAAVFSVAAPGCNLFCAHCQNYELSDTPRRARTIEGDEVAAETVIAAAVERGSRIVAYTYSEPTIYYEYMLAMARVARERGLLNVAVSNAYISEAPLRELAPLLDAANYDLKGFTDDFYRKVCGGRLAPVLKTIEVALALGVWIEVTTLIIPGLNDSEEELRGIARFLKGLSPDLPWHVSAFHPTHRMLDRPPTPATTLTRARELGRAEGLRYVYTGNVADADGSATLCPGCGAAVLEREGFSTRRRELRDGSCARCGTAIAGRGLSGRP